jgi:hypothetical protein
MSLCSTRRVLVPLFPSLAASGKGSCRIIRRRELAIEVGGVQLLKPVYAFLMHTGPAFMQAGYGRTFLLQAFEARRSIPTSNDGPDELRL